MLSDRLRAQLNRSIANPEYSGSVWDVGMFWGDAMYYQVALDLYSDEDCDWGDLRIIPIREPDNGALKKPLPYPIIPGPWARTWAIQILGEPDERNDTFLVTGTLAATKHQVGLLLASPVHPFPRSHLHKTGKNGGRMLAGKPSP